MQKQGKKIAKLLTKKRSALFRQKKKGRKNKRRLATVLQLLQAAAQAGCKDNLRKALPVRKKAVTLQPLSGVTADRGRVMDYVAWERQTIFN